MDKPKFGITKPKLTLPGTPKPAQPAKPVKPGPAKREDVVHITATPPAPPDDQGQDFPVDDEVTDAADGPPEMSEKLKAYKARAQAEAARVQAATDPMYYLAYVFQSEAQRGEFQTAWGLGPDLYVNGRLFSRDQGKPLKTPLLPMPQPRRRGILIELAAPLHTIGVGTTHPDYTPAIHEPTEWERLAYDEVAEVLAALKGPQYPGALLLTSNVVLTFVFDSRDMKHEFMGLWGLKHDESLFVNGWEFSARFGHPLTVVPEKGSPRMKRMSSPLKLPGQ